MAGENLDRRPCPPAVRGYIAQMEALMQRQEFNHAATPAQLAVELIRAGLISSLADFEACLRDMGSRVHFIGAPLDYFGDKFSTVYPTERPEQPEWTLYTAVNGAGEAAAMRERLVITKQENLFRLETTGILVPRQDK